ncbi:uncharacterized protein LOC121405888 [Lytechinus variegatus]|uniref:uncharacterized protein LOC121405888 n=1 Tax=Lytechinus variegatus TaxID=7654 RepID=UPI001BB154F4|nr:uncharacterized protein LOC121405888 [Lytechinus variegatus]
MLLNEDVMKSASLGSKKGYFATFFIPPADEDECVFQDIIKTEKEWRPDTSLSHHTSTSSSRSNRGSKSPRGRAGQRGRGGARSKSATRSIDFDLDDGDPERDRNRVSTARSSKAMSVLSWGGYSDSTPPPPPSRSAMRSHAGDGRRSIGRGQPIKYAFDQGKAFATPTERTKKTCEVIKDANRGSGGDSKERTCRPYSSYTVYQKRENIAISPYGEPNLKGAAGRYREQYQTITNSVPPPNDSTKESRDYVFKKFLENLTARSSLAGRSPIGTLKKPPPKPVRKPSAKLNSKIDHLHKQAKARMTSVQKDLSSENKLVKGHHGVEYVIAMELSHNLEKHRMKRSYSFPSLPTVAVAANTTTRLDAPRLRTQSVNHLTPGETAIRGGIETNVFDSERSKRGPLTCIERKPRVRSPPLSKLSRDRFLPEAIRRREIERQESLAGLRITANTPVTDWKTETDRRPSLTATTKMQLDSLASKSIENLNDVDDDCDDGRSDNVENNSDHENLDTNDCAVEDLYNDDEQGQHSGDENTQAADQAGEVRDDVDEDCGVNDENAPSVHEPEVNQEVDESQADEKDGTGVVSGSLESEHAGNDVTPEVTNEEGGGKSGDE